MKYEPAMGETIDETARSMSAAANKFDEPCEASFNEVGLVCLPGQSAEEVAGHYRAECDARRKTYEASPEFQRRETEASAREAARKSSLESGLLGAPERMTLKDADGWAKAVAANTDPYGSCVMRYAETWARLMEARVAAGETVGECAKETSHVADTEGITGFMYGCAVSALAQCWVHGEELRRWHNLDTQIGTEGQKANDAGGVLNPALLSIG